MKTKFCYIIVAILFGVIFETVYLIVGDLGYAFFLLYLGSTYVVWMLAAAGAAVFMR